MPQIRLGIESVIIRIDSNRKVIIYSMENMVPWMGIIIDWIFLWRRLELLEAIYFWKNRKQSKKSDLKLHKTIWRIEETIIPNSVKKLRYVKCYNSSSYRSIKSQTVLSETVKMAAVEQKDLKPLWKSQKKPYFLRWFRWLLFTGFTAILPTDLIVRLIIWSMS